MLDEYIVAGTSKGDFCSRLRAILGDKVSSQIASELQSARNSTNTASALRIWGQPQLPLPTIALNPKLPRSKQEQRSGEP